MFWRQLLLWQFDQLLNSLCLPNYMILGLSVCFFEHTQMWTAVNLTKKRMLTWLVFVWLQLKQFDWLVKKLDLCVKFYVSMTLVIFMVWCNLINYSYWFWMPEFLSLQALHFIFRMLIYVKSHYEFRKNSVCVSISCPFPCFWKTFYCKIELHCFNHKLEC